MTEKCLLYIEVFDNFWIEFINSLIHDQWFSLSETVHDSSEGLLKFTFKYIIRQGWRQPITDAVGTLQIHDVISWSVNDSEKVDRYDFNKLKYDEHASVIHVTTGIPLQISVSVKTFHLSATLQRP